MAREGFRFLDLPKELRLNVYDHLLECENVTSITTQPLQFLTRWDSYDANPPTLPLVLPGPIAPIHLVCKALLLEAGAYMRLFLERKGLAFRAPRMIIRTRLCTAYAAHLEPVLNSIFRIIFSETQKAMNRRLINLLRIYNAVHIATGRKPTSTELEPIKAYIEYAANFPTKNKISGQSRYTEAEKLGSTEVAQADGPQSNTHGAMSKPMEVKHDLVLAPAVTRESFQIVVHVEYVTAVNLYACQILDNIRRICECYKTRVGVRISGTDVEPTYQPGAGRWIKHDVHMDEKAWLKESA